MCTDGNLISIVLHHWEPMPLAQWVDISDRLVGYWRFRSWQYMKSHQDWSRLVTVFTHGDFIVRLYSETASTIIWYLTQSHYPDTEHINPCPILLMPNNRLTSDTHQICIPSVWHCHGSNQPPHTHKASQCSHRLSQPAQHTPVEAKCNMPSSC